MGEADIPARNAIHCDPGCFHLEVLHVHHVTEVVSSDQKTLITHNMNIRVRDEIYQVPFKSVLLTKRSGLPRMSAAVA